MFQIERGNRDNFRILYFSISSPRCLIKCDNIQQNFNGSNSFGTMKIRSREGKFELMSVNHSARSGGIKGISFRFSLT